MAPMAKGGRLSPIPDHRAPSPNQPSSSLPTDAPRPSISSGRSFKRSQADFEAALLDPSSTIFLRASPTLDHAEPNAHARDGIKAAGPSGGGDVDAPVPVEQRSYEDDLKGLGLAREHDPTTPFGSPRGVSGNVGVIPPTPSPKKAVAEYMTPRRNGDRVRKISHATTMSQDSGTSTMSPGRTSNVSASSAKKAQSLGIDAELNESQKMTEGSAKNKASHKRRSIFRSAGTASSPDLAHMARKGESPKRGTVDKTRNDGYDRGGGLHGKMTLPTRHAPAPPLPASHTVHHGLSSIANAEQPGQARPSTVNPRRTASRATAASGSGSEDGWDRIPDLKGVESGSPERMATISERAPSRTLEPTSEGSKSLRNKAKGMFGRMFGAGSTKDSPPGPKLSSSTSTRATSANQHRPPVPPIASAHQPESESKRRESLPEKDSTQPPASVPPPQNQLDTSKVPIAESSTPLQTTGGHSESPPEHGRQSITPTGRRPSDNVVSNLDKPLPSIDPSQISPIPSYKDQNRSAPKHATLHRRQPAESNGERHSPDYVLRASPGPPASSTFSADVVGLFASIGQSDPAKELGLAPDSIRSRNRSVDIPAPSKNRFPVDLGRSASIDSPGRKTGSEPVLSVPVAPRTSSLPINGSLQPASEEVPAHSRARRLSSPSPSPRHLPAEDLTLKSSSSKVDYAFTGFNSSLGHDDESGRSGRTSPDAGSQQFVNSDFGPKNGRWDNTIRGPKSSDTTVTSTPSVRLVSAPRVGRESGSSEPPTLGEPLTQTSATGRKTPGEDEQPESAQTPGADDEDDDEEKGRRLACEFLDSDYSSVPLEKVAEFLGGPRKVNAVALRYYMLYFNMKGQTLVEAFRDLCAKLHLRAESQEIDRIIEGFSARYYDCNPTTVFGSPGVVHTVTAAMLMLNTDLHIADLSKHMSRPDFVRNALRAIEESSPRDGDDSASDAASGSNASLATAARTRPSSASAPSQRSASAPVMLSPRAPEEGERPATAVGPPTNGQARSSSTTVSSFAYSKQWESEAENALKDIYNQVKSDKILLPIGTASTPNSNRQSVVSLGSDSRGIPMRSPSGRANDRINVLRRGSVRGTPGLANNPYFSSDGRLSPSGSYATSIGDNGNFAASIGFASNLSHTVIREHEDEKDSIASGVSADTTDEDMDDDELALLGAPWAKEGMLWRRSGNEPVIKKTSKKDWKQFFAVVQRGEILLFTFGENSGGGSFGAVGGGNWLNNANAAGRFSLVHTTSNALKGGYARDRPHVFVIKLTNDEALYLQAGTDDLVTEWVQTCNYWSARRTRHPLQGGVSNVEYGWNRLSELSIYPSHSKEGAHSPEDDRASVMSGRSNLSRFNSTPYGRRSTGATPADRMHIVDWRPPQPSLMPSPLDEENQLETLVSYSKALREELEQHRQLQEPMLKLFAPHTKNATKALANWNAKWNYLSAEVARYEGYVGILRDAIALRVKKQGERKLEKSLTRSMTSFHRRESADELSRAMVADSPNGPRNRREIPWGLTIGEGDGTMGRQADDRARTPVAAMR